MARFVRAAARASARRPKTAIALWIALIVACTAAGSLAGTRTLSDSASGVGESAHATRALAAAHLRDPAREQILVQSDSAARTSAAIDRIARDARGLRFTGSVRTPADDAGLSTGGGRSGLVVVSLRGDPDDADDHVDGLLRVVARAQHTTPGVSIREAGVASSDHAMSETIGHGLRNAEIVSIPLTLIILVLAFGALVAASVPLLFGLTSVGAAMGALGLVSHVFPSGDSTAPVVVLIGLAVGVDYSLFYIRRERAERRAGRGRDAALDATAATVGRAILVAGMTVVIGLAGLLVSGFGVFTSMAAGAIVVVAVAVLGSLTVLPAVLALLGDRIDRGRVWPRRGRRHTSTGTGGSAWANLARGVTGHPRTALALSVLALAGLAVPVLRMHTANDDISSLPRSVPAVQAQQAVQRAFPGTSDTAELVVSGHALRGPAARATLRALGERGRRAAGGHGAVAVRVSADGRTARVTVPVSGGDRARTTGDVHRLRALLKPATARALPGAHAQLTGDDAEGADFSARLSSVTPLVIAFTLALAFALLLATFGSPLLAISVMGLNLLSVGAAFGLLVTVFQGTWAQSLLHFDSSGAIINWLPLFAFVVLFGLSMDYTVLVLERAAEERRAGASARQAAAAALRDTGSTVTSAALVMVAVFAVFATLPSLDFKQMGVGLAAAIALDATIVRGVALPAALTLLGDRGLRPARRRRRRARADAAPGWDHRPYATTVEAGHE